MDEPDSEACVGFLLRDTASPHSVICITPDNARQFARQVRELIADRSDQTSTDRSLEGLHEADLTLGERVVGAWSVLRQRPRTADVWIARYLRLESGTEMIMIELGSRRERRAHSALHLDLPTASTLADELERTAGAAERT